MPEIKRPVLRYHGGKFMLAKWIISHFPEHKIYVECFGGGASVLMQKKRSYAEVYNDLWDDVVNVFEILRDKKKAKELERLLKYTPFARTEFLKTYTTGNLSKLERARQTIFRSFAGFSAGSSNPEADTGFRANSNRSGSIPAHDWKNYPKHIESFSDRMQGVIIESRDYKKVIEQTDGSNTLFYLDPPYVHASRNMKHKYAIEFTEKDHIELFEIISNIKGKVILSGYHSELYDRLYKDWRRVERQANADGANKRVEVLWFSPNCPQKVNTLF